MSVTRHCPTCGAPFEVAYPSTVKKHCSRSCGAKPGLSRNKRHGMSFTPVHNAWCDMRKRCSDPGHHAWSLYGGRGITVCARWDIFENFYEDMGDKPGKGYSIDRIDVNGNYEPSNCKWATQLEQSRNRRNAFGAELDEKLRTMLPKGYSYRQIGDLIGKTKGAVSARAKRLGLGSIALPARKSSELNFRAPVHEENTHDV